MPSAKCDILLVTPPFTQLNTPYPATAYLKGFLNTKNITSFQVDLGIEVMLELFSKAGLPRVFAAAELDGASHNAQRIFALQNRYLQTIEPVIAFLQGRQPTLARLICAGNYLPEASRFAQLGDSDWAFGQMGFQDQAKHLATLYIEDLADFITECVDPHFGLSRYAERLGRSAYHFDELQDALGAPAGLIDETAIAILDQLLQTTQPKLVCFSVPFPGNLYSAFRCAAHVKANYPAIKTAMGGGFPNTELRELKEPRVFDAFDFITLDDGEVPIELLFQQVSSGAEITTDTVFKRTYYRSNGKVVYQNNSTKKDYTQSEVGTPDYSDLPLHQYLSVIEVANPMHSLWSDGRWNKLTMAHGCYWGKCTFCDISLDYIHLYQPVAAKLLVDRMEALIAQTGETGFHFVDEAAPPALMRELALEILRRNLTVTWWTNIRFEKSFTYDLCRLLQASGCIAVSGGLEVASDRLLDLIQKGVTVAQVAQVTDNLTSAGIMVHAYLMYGYPSQTVQETVDSLEMVRQLFQAGVIQSGFWHQFALTAHSPVYAAPEAYNITVHEPEATFAKNDIEYTDHTGIDHNMFSYGLRKSLYNYMHGTCFEFPLQEWFDFNIPRTTIHPDYIADCIASETPANITSGTKIGWLHALPTAEAITSRKKGKVRTMLQLTCTTSTDSFTVTMPEKQGEWWLHQMKKMEVTHTKLPTVHHIQTDFESHFPQSGHFLNLKGLQQLRDNGLLIL